MRKNMYLLVLFVFFTTLVSAMPTDDQIQNAAVTLGVPFSELKKFVQTYQPRNISQGIIEIDAPKLYKEYKVNQLKSDMLYKGKTLKIAGKVIGINKDYNDEYYLMLQSGDSSYDDYVWVYFKEAELINIVDLTAGLSVIVVGQCKGFFAINVEIRDAYLEK